MGTLIWINNNDDDNQILIRPYVQSFLENMSKYYDIILFSEEPVKFNSWILKVIDPQSLILQSFSQKDNIRLNGCFVKDLKSIGLNLNNSILIDDDIKNFHFQP